MRTNLPTSSIYEKINIESLEPTKELKFFFYLLKNLKKNRFFFNHSLLFNLKMKNIKNITNFYYFFIWGFLKTFKNFYFTELLLDVRFFDVKNYYGAHYYFFLYMSTYDLYDRFFDKNEFYGSRFKKVDKFLNDNTINNYLIRVFSIFLKRKSLFLRKKVRIYKYEFYKKIFIFFKELNLKQNYFLKKYRALFNILINYESYLTQKIHYLDFYFNFRLNLHFKYLVYQKDFFKYFVRKNIFLFWFFRLKYFFFVTKQKLRTLTYKHTFKHIIRKLRLFVRLFKRQLRYRKNYLRIRKLIKISLMKKKEKKKMKKLSYLKKKRGRNRWNNKWNKIFKARKAILHFRPSYSNYFITMTDLSYKTVICYSSGQLSTSNNKKTKTSSTVAYSLIKILHFFIKLHKIKKLIFEIKNRLDSFFYQTISFLKYRRLKIYRLHIIKKYPHHLGLRKRKLRRI